MIKKIVYYVLLVAISLLFLFSSFSKLTDNPMAAAAFQIAHLPLWFMYFIGACEALGAIGLWIPFLRIFAAWGLFIILLGAIVVTVIYVNPVEALFPLSAAIVLVAITKLRKQGAPLIHL